MEYKNIISLESDSIGRITLNDPPYNALSIEMMAEISEALSIFRTSDIKVLILEARGTFFSTGLDLREHLDASIEDVIRVYHTVFSNLERIHAPTLALVGGAALGAGFELLLSCDMVIASDAAEFGLPQVRAGTIPTIAPTLLPRIMPGKKAVELMLTGDSVGANKAMELMGSYGFSSDYHIEKYLRDVKILQLWLGGPQRALLDTALGYYDFEW